MKLKIRSTGRSAADLNVLFLMAFLGMGPSLAAAEDGLKSLAPAKAERAISKVLKEGAFSSETPKAGSPAAPEPAAVPVAPVASVPAKIILETGQFATVTRGGDHCGMDVAMNKDGTQIAVQYTNCTPHGTVVLAVDKNDPNHYEGMLHETYRVQIRVLNEKAFIGGLGDDLYTLQK